MFSRHFRLRSGQRHYVLELIAKSVGAARLIERRSRPHPAGECLVDKPSVQQYVHGAIGGLHLNRAEDVVPKPGHLAEYQIEIDGSVALDQGKRCRLRRRLAKKENHLGRSVWPELDGRLQGATRIEAGADAIRERLASSESQRVIQSPIAAEKLRPIACAAALPSSEVCERHVAAEFSA